MSKKTIILITSIILIIGLTSYGVWYFRSGAPETKTFNDFIPFGFPSNGESDTTINKKDPLLQDGTVRPIQRLRQISNSSTAGAIVLKAGFNPDVNSDDTGTTTPDAYIVRYMDRATGHIYETDVVEIKSERITNTTIPKVHETFFNESGESLILRYLNDNKEIESYYASIVKKENSEDKNLEGSFLQKNIDWLIPSPDKNKIFYLFQTDNSVVGIKSDFNGENKTQIFNFPFTEWLPQWVNNKYIYITTKPSAGVAGYMYSLGVKNGNMKKVFGDINGLTTISNSAGSAVLYSKSSRNGFSTNIYRNKSKETEPIPLTTLPEKCVWSSDDVIVYCGVPFDFEQGEYPDIWYQGLTSFSDGFWKINTKTDAIDFIIDPFESNKVEIDAIKLFLSEDENHLFFTNKKDMTLWVLDLQFTIES